MTEDRREDPDALPAASGRPEEPRRGESPSIAFITLGCPKNLVDSERMAGGLARAGFRLTGEVEQAEIAVVNTCAFLTASQQESIEAILDVARYKDEGRLRALIVTGCLPERHGDAVMEEIPEIDYLLGPGTLHELPAVAAGLLDGALGRGSRLGALDRLEPEWEPRVLSGMHHSAYLKISEGCDHRCSFCIIPRLRGRHRSRPPAEIEAEARQLAAAGVRELTLVAQDTTAYGLDLGGEESLDRLLDRLDAIDGLRWVRLLYTYPRGWTDRLLERFGRLSKLVPYVDIPIQHAAGPVLRRMARGLDWDRTHALLRKIRAAAPEMVLRTTVITGFPGETDEDHGFLLRALREFEFDHLGAFAYSTEDGTPAGAMAGQLPEEVREERRRAVLEQQRGIALRRNRSRIGRRLEVLIDRLEPERGIARGRFSGQAPEIDGEVILPYRSAGADGTTIRTGSFVSARVRGAGPYDLIASPEEEPEQ